MQNRRGNAGCMSIRLFLPLLFASMVVVQPLVATGAAPKTEFTIEARQKVGRWFTSGSFRASGAVKGHGDAISRHPAYPEYDLVLTSRKGEMMILFDYESSQRTWVDDDTALTEGVVFLVVDASGEYAETMGTAGMASRLDYAFDGYDLNGDGVYNKRKWTLTGSLAP